MKKRHKRRGRTFLYGSSFFFDRICERGVRKMLTFNLPDGKNLEIERDAIEEKILFAIFDKFEQAREKDSGMYTILKQSVNMIMTFGKVDIKVPKGENTLEYLVAHYVGLGLDVLEAAPLKVEGKVVDTNVEASRD